MKINQITLLIFLSDPPDQDGGTRRSRREIHPVLKSLSGPTLSDLELDSEATDASDAASPGFDKDDSEDEWAPQDRRSAKKKPLFSKPPTQGADDKIKPASPEPDSSSTDLDQMSLLPPALRTPGASPAKPDQLGMVSNSKVRIYFIWCFSTQEAVKHKS